VNSRRPARWRSPSLRRRHPCRDHASAQRIAVTPIAQHELALIVRAPEHIRLGGPGEGRAGRAWATTAPMFQEAMVIEDGVDGADDGQVGACELLPQFLADLDRTGS
jgi:hypothetical protein